MKIQITNKNEIELKPELKFSEYSKPKQEFKIELKLSKYYRQTIQFYENIVDFYDLLYPDHLKESKRIFEELKHLFQVKKIKTALDAACGIGYDMSILHEMDLEVSGIDISQSMVSKTKANFQKIYGTIPLVKQLDARQLTESNFENKFDLVLFRGNTFSNILPNEIPLVINNLLNVLSNDGILIIDYRDGIEQISENKKFELRGLFYDEEKGQLLESYYFIKHSHDLTIPYKVEASVNLLLINESKEQIQKKWNIHSHYVDSTIIEKHLRDIGVRFNYVDNIEGLPYLKTMIITK